MVSNTKQELKYKTQQRQITKEISSSIFIIIKNKTPLMVKLRNLNKTVLKKILETEKA